MTSPCEPGRVVRLGRATAAPPAPVLPPWRHLLHRCLVMHRADLAPWEIECCEQLRRVNRLSARQERQLEGVAQCLRARGDAA